MSNLFKTKPEDHVKIMEIATMMHSSGLPSVFVSAAAMMAQEYEGTFDLLVLWHESDEEERVDIIAHLQEELDHFEEQPGNIIEKPYVAFNDLEAIGKDVVRFKKALKLEVDKHGGISELSKKSGIPQPSLSRFFNTASMPRRTTLFKIAKAFGLPEKIVVSEWID